MEFSPYNGVVKLCIQGMVMDDRDRSQEASKLFQQAWNEATDDHERFLAAHFVARHQENAQDKLRWLETALQLALKVNDDAVKAAFPPLYSSIAECFEQLGDLDAAKENHELADSFDGEPTDKGPFYHGTKADLQVGDLLTAGSESNYQAELVMNHVYFTALANGAGLAASLAKGDARERVFIVEPTGGFENDPNVTNKKFPGNPTRSYRSTAPLKIIGEVTDWAKQTPDDLNEWREKLAKGEGKIIN